MIISQTKLYGNKILFISAACHIKYQVIRYTFVNTFQIDILGKADIKLELDVLLNSLMQGWKDIREELF